MAFADAEYAQPAASKASVEAYGLNPVRRTARVEPASTAQEGRETNLVGTNHPDQNSTHHFLPSPPLLMPSGPGGDGSRIPPRRASVRRSFSTSANEAPLMRALATMTMSTLPSNRNRFRLNASRISRFALVRSTERLRERRPAITPRRRFAPGPDLRNRIIVCPRNRRPCSSASLKTAASPMRNRRGSD